MTGRERTLRALSFQEVDRPPVAGGLLQNAELLARVAGVADFWEDPWGTSFAAFRRLGCDAILGPVMPKRPEATTTDASGRPTDFSRAETKPELTTPEQVADWAAAQPTPEAVRAGFDLAAARDEYAEIIRRGQEAAGDMLFIPHCLAYAPGFPTSDGHFRYEAFLMACVLYPDRMRGIFEYWGEQSRLQLEAVAQATVEHDLLRLVWIGQDICDAKGPMLSPRLLEQLYFPAAQRAIAPLKAAGMKVVWHCDANYRLILDRMIALGLDGFQGFYETEAGIRLQDLAAKRTPAGDPLILFGSLSTVWVLPYGSPAEARQEVDRCVEAVGPQGGLLLAPSSSIGPEVPEANVLALLDHATRYVPSWRLPTV
jgi:hypothetical protein